MEKEVSEIIYQLRVLSNRKIWYDIRGNWVMLNKFELDQPSVTLLRTRSQL